LKAEFEAYKKQFPPGSPPNAPLKKAKASIKFIEDSDDEDDSKTLDLRENKIVLKTNA